MSNPKVLFWDIETAPIIAHVWGIWDQNVGLNQIMNDWHLLSWAAKWQHESKVMYMDQRSAKNITDDKKILEALWELLDEADVVVTQNGKAFDQKKVNARFILHGMQPPSSYKHIDTLLLAKKHFAFTSNKLEYLADRLNTKYKKLKDHKFPGHDLWVECLKGNKAAFEEMERYNRQDVLALEELYNKLMPWASSQPFAVFGKDCACSAPNVVKKGFFYSDVGKFQRYKCTNCGAASRDRVSCLSKDEKSALRSGVSK
jgi:uncharacterized protein YprB with RNaseH-like and TPR domain